MSAATDQALRARVRNLESMPAMPAVLGPLLRSLELPADQIEVEKITELISTDKSIAVQCLRMANSPLFSPMASIETVRGAVIALGSRRLREILWSSFLVRMTQKAQWPSNPQAFWEHSLGCALMSQKLGARVGLPQPDKIYLCGLLHDIGEVVNATVLPEEFKASVQLAERRQISLFEAEQQTMGFTHCDTGKLAADFWNLPPDLHAIIEFHHTPAAAESAVALIAVVNLADTLCRIRGMGYGFEEPADVEFEAEPAWELLERSVPRMPRFNVQHLAEELDLEAEQIKWMVSTVFQS